MRRHIDLCVVFIFTAARDGPCLRHVGHDRQLRIVGIFGDKGHCGFHGNAIDECPVFVKHFDPVAGPTPEIEAGLRDIKEEIVLV